LGWTLDAFDFFLLVFVLKDKAKGVAFGTGRIRDPSAPGPSLAMHF
jgi:hypothetical protein